MVEAVLGQGEHQLLHLHHRGQIGHEDASGLLSVALNRGNAAELTAAEVGDEIAIDLAPALSGDST